MTRAELVVTGGTVWDPAPSPATAVAVAAGRIVAVGGDDEITALAGPGTERIDAAGGAILPGFHDAHLHALAGGLAALGCDLSGVHSRDEYLAAIAAFAQGSDDEWLVGAGWFGDVFTGGLPDRGILDLVTADRPAVLTSHDAHGVWVNTAALRRAGVTAATADPPGGRIVRDAAGEPTGVLLDAAGELVTRLLPAPDRTRQRAGLLAAQDQLLALGITAWHDAIIGEYLTMADALPTYLDAIRDGSLIARVTGSIWWPADRGSEYVPEMIERVHAARAAGFAATGVKIMQDGICENCTAALLAPYEGVEPDITGDSVIPPDELSRIVAGLDAAGLRVHFHGVGDRAVRECLNAVAAARAANGPGATHQIAHLDLVAPDDIPRFAALGVTANLQPLWARADSEVLERKLPLIGHDRERWHFPYGSLQRAGAHLAIGSDWPVTSPDPLWALHTACTRTAPSGDVHAQNPQAREPMVPGEAMDPAAALRAYTAGSAEVVGLDAEVGALRPGLAADLALLDGPIEGAGSFDRLRVARTVIGGRTVYER